MINPDCATCKAHTNCRFPGASECLNYQKETNADRIRAMSDEDLAKFIEWSDCPPHDGVCDRDNITCSECWLNWLQSPAGGDGDD